MNRAITTNKNAGQSGIGLPHSTTLARLRACYFFREVVECGSPMPLSLLPALRAALCKSSGLSSFDFRILLLTTHLLTTHSSLLICPYQFSGV